MDVVTYTAARRNFKKTMEKVCDDHTPVVITRQNERPVVMLSLEDYNAIEETLYVLRSPKNATRLLQSVANVKRRRYTKQTLIRE